ncbi:hypothetical protein Ami103574_03410 [Aminipila butyrica]|uniref:Transcriptional coactivator p15 (PC4) C-terminal domain-containing protein n=1 Tax=Aminipila butyrica TaxID=433296 RepID=A0A858BR90_9FIRM|nr:PC4/YdbC family ssDNA-binding protein [Aminipila butyrica]QIB68421.1 hypothetical protein Ami103574_03410 [Aminipila butyrica]
MTGNEKRSNEKKNEEITFEVTEHIGVIATYSNRWTKELNKISWNGSKPKFDIRDWDEQHQHMSRGITLREEEMAALFDILKDILPETLNGEQAV